MEQHTGMGLARAVKKNKNANNFISSLSLHSNERESSDRNPDEIGPGDMIDRCQLGLSTFYE